MEDSTYKAWNTEHKRPPEKVRWLIFQWSQLKGCWFFTPFVMVAIPTLVVLGVFLLRWWYLDWPSWAKVNNPNMAALYGDAHGGVNALFSGLAFAGVILTILLQSHELRLQRKEIDESQATWKEQAGLMLFATVIEILGKQKDSRDSRKGHERIVADKSFDFMSLALLRRAYDLIPTMGIPETDVVIHRLSIILSLADIYSMPYESESALDSGLPSYRDCLDGFDKLGQMTAEKHLAPLRYGRGTAPEHEASPADHHRGNRLRPALLGHRPMPGPSRAGPDTCPIRTSMSSPECPRTVPRRSPQGPKFRLRSVGWKLDAQLLPSPTKSSDSWHTPARNANGAVTLSRLAT